MNSNEAIPNRNAETAPRFRYAENYVQNAPYLSSIYVPMQPFVYQYPHVVMAANNMHAQPSTNEHTTNMVTSGDYGGKQPCRVVHWSDIVALFEGTEERPNCGRLRNNSYFTQRSSSCDYYLVFDKKADYINNFVNYYFSDKNLVRDQTLLGLMDEKGVVPLSALIKFPKLYKVETSVNELIDAFQHNNFVMVCDTKTGERGAQRRDKICPTDIHSRNGIISNSSSGSNTNISGDNKSSSSITDGNSTDSSMVVKLNSLNNPTITMDNNNPTNVVSSIQTNNESSPIVGHPPQLYYPVNHPFYIHPTSLLQPTQTFNSVPIIYPIQSAFQSHANPQAQMQNQNPVTLWPISGDYTSPNLVSHIQYGNPTGSLINQSNAAANSRFMPNIMASAVQESASSNRLS